MKGMRPSEAFRALVLEVKNHMQIGDYANARKGGAAALQPLWR